MLFSKFFVAFALCCLQVCSASSDQFSYAVCMEDVEGTMEAFNDEFMFFEKGAHKWITQTLKICTSKLAEIHQETPCKSMDFVRQIFKVCGGVDMKAGDFIPTMDEIDTPEEACTWLSEKGPIFVEKLDQNKEMVTTCDVAKTFDQIVADGFCFIEKK